MSAPATPRPPVRESVRLATAMGEIVIALYLDHAPHTGAAFLREVDGGSYDGGAFFRMVRRDSDNGSPPIEVIQGACAPDRTTAVSLPHEPTSITGLRHEDGTVSLPRADGSGGTPQQFFICIGPQPALDAGGGRTTDGLGFAAFGRVIAGMEVVAAIHRVATGGAALSPIMQGQIASDPVPIRRATRLVESMSHG